MSRGNPDYAWKFKDIALDLLEYHNDILPFFFYIGFAYPERVDEISSWKHSLFIKRLAYASLLEGVALSDPHRALFQEINLEDEKEVSEILRRVASILISMHPELISKFNFYSPSLGTVDIKQKAYGFALLDSSSPTSEVTIVTDAKKPIVLVIGDSTIDLGAAGAFKIPLGAKVYHVDESAFTIPVNLVVDSLIILSQEKLNFSVIIDKITTHVENGNIGPCGFTLDQELEWKDGAKVKLTGVTCTSFGLTQKGDAHWGLTGACTCDGIDKCENCNASLGYNGHSM